MPRLGLANMLIGFALISLAAMGGAFVANDATLALAQDPGLLNTWGYILRKSSHGHTNLFGTLHVLFGLTIPYSKLNLAAKKAQTMGLLCGSLAMSIGMILRAQLSTAANENFLDYAVAAGLALALAALAAHVVGLALPFVVRR